MQTCTFRVAIMMAALILGFGPYQYHASQLACSAWRFVPQAGAHLRKAVGVLDELVDVLDVRHLRRQVCLALLGLNSGTRNTDL
jgi:hypothetical protein